MKNKNNEPITGVFLFANKVKNDGQIISEGNNPITHIETNDYSGTGILQSKQTRVNSVEKWWIKFILTIISGLIIAYFVFLFKWK